MDKETGFSTDLNISVGKVNYNLQHRNSKNHRWCRGFEYQLLNSGKYQLALVNSKDAKSFEKGLEDINLISLISQTLVHLNLVLKIFQVLMVNLYYLTTVVNYLKSLVKILENNYSNNSEESRK